MEQTVLELYGLCIYGSSLSRDVYGLCTMYMAVLYLEMCMDCIYGSSLSRDVYGLYIWQFFI